MKHFGHWTQWRIRVGIGVDPGLAELGYQRGREGPRTRSGDSLRFRSVNIDEVIEEGWTFADSAPWQLDVCGRRSLTIAVLAHFQR